jgi:hypothetical protein
MYILTGRRKVARYNNDGRTDIKSGDGTVQMAQAIMV